MKNKKHVGALALLAVAQQTMAIVGPVVPPVTELNPVVVTGTGTHHLSDHAALTVSVVNAKELQNVGATNLQEALQQLTSNISTHTNGMGTFVNFNGVSDDYIVILVNGRRVNGDDRWSRISMDNVSRIEVFNGAASALYGSDAIAGVINIITNDMSNDLEASAFTKILNNGRLTQDVNVDARMNKVWSYTSFSHKQANNWQNNHYQAFDEGDDQVLKLTGRPMSVAYRSDNIDEKLEWRKSNNLSFYASGNYNNYRTARPKDATYFTQKSTKNDAGEKEYSYTSKKAYTYDLHHQTYGYGAGMNWKATSKAHILLDVNCDNYTSMYDYWQTDKEEAHEDIRKETRYVNETLKGIFQLTKWNQLSAGLDLVQETLESETDNIDHESTYTENLFVQDEVQVRKWLDALAGVRYTYNNDFGSNFSPNVAFVAHHKGLQFRASYAKGYKTPTLSQLHATDQAKTSARYTIYNLDLKPEQNNFWNLSAGYNNRKFKCNVSAFMNNITDMINYRTLTQDEIDNSEKLTALYNEGWTTIRQRSNLDKAEIKGVSGDVKVNLPAGFSIGGRYTYTDTEAETKELNKKTQEYEITKSPVDKSVKHAGQVNMAWDKKWTKRYRSNICINGHAQDKRYSSTYGYAPGYGMWDLSTRHTIAYDKFLLEPGIGIENIFDKKDDRTWNSNYSTISPGRSVYVSLSLKFKE